ncbi:MAG: hypothetical protein VX205_01145, partial [Pseudomonadota bacterium]|nr:hypothetical protein [Pseudomonadota bacterium]
MQQLVTSGAYVTTALHVPISKAEPEDLMKITMIGTGYVGLVSGACFADFGHDVVCVDKDAGKIAAIESGRMPIF